MKGKVIVCCLNVNIIVDSESCLYSKKKSKSKTKMSADKA